MPATAAQAAAALRRAMQPLAGLRVISSIAIMVNCSAASDSRIRSSGRPERLAMHGTREAPCQGGKGDPNVPAVRVVDKDS